MSVPLYQIAAKVNPGTAMQWYRRHQLQVLRQSSPQTPSFAEQLHRATRQQKAPDAMPVEAGDHTPDIMPVTTHPKSEIGPDTKPGTIDEMPAERNPRPLDVLRAQYRDNYRLGFRLMRKRYPELGQGQMGWVMAEMSRALTDDPSMTKKDLKQLVNSLVHSAPEYEEAA